MPTKNLTRAHRLEEQILKEIADIIYNDVKDPRMGFITLTDVELTKDLQRAIAYYTVLNDKDKIPTQQALESSKSFVRKELAKRLTIYHVPELTFKYDTSIERGANIADLIEQINQQQKEK